MARSWGLSPSSFGTESQECEEPGCRKAVGLFSFRRGRESVSAAPRTADPAQAPPAGRSVPSLDPRREITLTVTGVDDTDGEVVLEVLEDELGVGAHEGEAPG